MPRKKKNCENHRFITSVSSVSINKDKPIQRNAANARERARMRVLSRAFCRLKTTLPWVPADTKLSKLDTLRLAASYIAHLKGILREEPFGIADDPVHPAMNLTWPYGFNRTGGCGTGNVGGSSGSEDAVSGSSCLHLDHIPPSSVGGGRRNDVENREGEDEDEDDIEDEDEEEYESSNHTNRNHHHHHYHHVNMSSNALSSSPSSLSATPPPPPPPWSYSSYTSIYN